MPRVKREKYPEKAPWDLGPLSEYKNQDCWRLTRGSEIVIFARKQEDNHFFIMQRDDKEPLEKILSERMNQRLRVFKHLPRMATHDTE